MYTSQKCSFLLRPPARLKIQTFKISMSALNNVSDMIFPPTKTVQLPFRKKTSRSYVHANIFIRLNCVFIFIETFTLSVYALKVLTSHFIRSWSISDSCSHIHVSNSHFWGEWFSPSVHECENRPSGVALGSCIILHSEVHTSKRNTSVLVEGELGGYKYFKQVCVGQTSSSKWNEMQNQKYFKGKWMQSVWKIRTLKGPDLKSIRDLFFLRHQPGWWTETSQVKNHQTLSWRHVQVSHKIRVLCFTQDKYHKSAWWNGKTMCSN